MHVWFAFTRGLERRVSRCFEKLGGSVGLHPKKTLLILLPLLTLCVVFPMTVVLNTSVVEMASTGGPSSVHRLWILDAFGFYPRQEKLRIWKEDGSVLTPACFLELFDLSDVLFSLRLPNGLGAYDLCADAPRCSVLPSALKYWNMSRVRFDDEVMSASDPQQALLDAVNAPEFFDGSAVVVEQFLGGIARDQRGRVASAHTLLWQWQLKEAVHAEEWESLAIDAVQEHALQEVEATLLFDRSWDDEVAKTVSGDGVLFLATLAVMTSVVALSFSRCCRVGRRALLGVLGVACTLLSIFAGYGLVSAFGVDFTILTAVLPFALVGIAVDDLFVIFSSYHSTDPSLPRDRRLACALHDVGMAITATTVTDILAFGLGTISGVPSIRWFCTYAVTSLAVDFVQTITVFPALLVLLSPCEAAPLKSVDAGIASCTPCHECEYACT